MVWDNLISRLFWLLLQPSNLLVLFFLIGVIFIWKGRKKAGLKLLVSCIGFYMLVMFGPAVDLLLVPLEKQFSPYTNNTSHSPYSGIIVLAGSESLHLSAAHNQVSLNEAAERLIEAAKLARQYPSLPLIYSGGSKIDGLISEPYIARKFFLEAGISPERIRFEDKSYNSYTNALESKKLIRENETSPWLLVTSAFHMPRSVAVFRKAGIKIQPYPVDYRSDLSFALLRKPDAGKNFKNLDYAVHEWIGLLFYRLRGYSDEIFPSIEEPS